MGYDRLMAKDLVLISALILLAGCPGQGGLGRDGRVDQQLESHDLGQREAFTFFACDTIDILFVIDNSNTMEAEQQNLAANFPKFIQRIQSIVPAITSYHVGVISTDIGAGPYTFTGSSCKLGGDEGRLKHQPAAGGAACKTSYPKFLTGPSAEMEQDFACIAELGLNGCGFEQQMESALVALTSQPYNEGFVRKDAPLAIIFISDEDDCSAVDLTLFDPAGATSGPLPTRCVRLKDKLHPIARYVDGFQGLKTDSRRVVVGVVSGPVAQIQMNGDQTQVLPACSSSKFGAAAPGNRFAELVKSFGDRGVHENLCSGDLASALDVIGRAIERTCLELE
jgi:hypothetical protein